MLKVGRVIKATAGRDKDRFFCIVQLSGDSAALADGKTRPLEKPKSKNVKHIRMTTTVLDLNIVGTNKQLRAALRPLNEAVQQEKHKEGGNRFCQKQM